MHSSAQPDSYLNFPVPCNADKEKINMWSNVKLTGQGNADED